MKKLSLLSIFFFLTACSKYLYVQQQKVDCSALASVCVDTPDPKQDCPPCGQRLVIHWKTPKCSDKLFLKTRVIFWDLTEETYLQPIQNNCSADYYFPTDLCNKNPILAYKISIETAKGKIIDTWEHKLWVKIIDLPSAL